MAGATAALAASGPTPMLPGDEALPPEKRALLPVPDMFGNRKFSGDLYNKIYGTNFPSDASFTIDMSGKKSEIY